MSVIDQIAASDLGIHAYRPQDQALDQDYTRSLVSGISQLGAQLRDDLAQITINRQSQQLSQQLLKANPNSETFPQQAIGAVLANPLAAKTPQAQLALSLLGAQHKQWLQQNKPMEVSAGASIYDPATKTFNQSPYRTTGVSGASTRPIPITNTTRGFKDPVTGEITPLDPNVFPPITARSALTTTPKAHPLTPPEQGYVARYGPATQGLESAQPILEKAGVGMKASWSKLEEAVTAGKITRAEAETANHWLTQFRSASGMKSYEDVGAKFNEAKGRLEALGRKGAIATPVLPTDGLGANAATKATFPQDALPYEDVGPAADGSLPLIPAGVPEPTTTRGEPVFKDESAARSSGAKSGDIIVMINPATGQPGRARLK